MAKDESLKRLGGGGWQTKDGRFTIQADSGRWSVVDAQRTDDLGLPLVRGPFATLTEAKAALDEARADEAASPLAKRLAEAKSRPRTDVVKGPVGAGHRTAGRDRQTARDAPEHPPEPPEPIWLAKLDRDAKARAQRLITALAELGVADPQDVVREDVKGTIPVVARTVLIRRLALLADEAAGSDATTDQREQAARIVGLIAEWLSSRGREPGPRLALPGWRLVEDGDDGRRIEISRADVERAVKRSTSR
jgi:hypothetical protein